MLRSEVSCGAVAFVFSAIVCASLPAAQRDTRSWEQLSEKEQADRMRDAKAAVEALNGACERWAKADAKGEDTDALRKEIFAADNRFESTGTAAGYGPLAARYRPDRMLGAGSYTLDDGREYSFIIGFGDEELAMWIWSHGPWTRGTARAGARASLNIPAAQQAAKLKAVRAMRVGKGSKTVFKVPYTYGELSGTVEIPVVDELPRVDHGKCDKSGNWYIAATTRPAR